MQTKLVLAFVLLALFGALALAQTFSRKCIYCDQTAYFTGKEVQKNGQPSCEYAHMIHGDPPEHRFWAPCQ